MDRKERAGLGLEFWAAILGLWWGLWLAAAFYALALVSSPDKWMLWFGLCHGILGFTGIQILFISERKDWTDSSIFGLCACLFSIFTTFIFLLVVWAWLSSSFTITPVSLIILATITELIVLGGAWIWISNKIEKKLMPLTADPLLNRNFVSILIVVSLIFSVFLSFGFVRGQSLAFQKQDTGILANLSRSCNISDTEIAITVPAKLYAYVRQHYWLNIGGRRYFFSDARKELQIKATGKYPKAKIEKAVFSWKLAASSQAIVSIVASHPFVRRIQADCKY